MVTKVAPHIKLTKRREMSALTTGMSEYFFLMIIVYTTF